VHGAFQFVAFVSLLTPATSHAWGRRGHSIVCQTAAAILAVRAPGGAFLKKHSFDLGYQCNVPDLIWKKPATYSIEAPQHFMDLEVFIREFKKSALPAAGDPFLLSRADFEAEYPSIPMSAGRSYWRIREMMDSLERTTTLLRDQKKRDQKKTDQAARDDLQEQWLIQAGAIGHYVGDLAQPLHVTEDFDGQMEHQKGIHAFFEDQVVDELSSTDHPGQLESEVGEVALKKWKATAAATAGLSTLAVIEDVARESSEALPALLKIDKRVGRHDIKKAAAAFAPMIKQRLAAGALALAVLWSRELGWDDDGNQFYNFMGAPDYIYPNGASSVSLKPAQALVVRPAQAPVATPAGPTPKR
jgi:hypothetical protein